MVPARIALPALLVIAASLSCAELPSEPERDVEISGIVTDRDGSPMAGALLYFRKTPTTRTLLPTPSTAYVETRPDGKYTVRLRQGIYQVSIYPDYHSGYAPAMVDSVAFGSDGRFDFRFAWLRLAVRALLNADVPSTNVHVWLYPLDPRSSYYGAVPKVVGDELVLYLPPGGYMLHVEPGYLSGYLTHRSEIQLTADRAITVPLGGHAVRARVIGPGGQPMGAASVMARSGESYGEVRTDLDGTATLYLPDGLYEWHVRAPVSYVASRRFPDILVKAALSVDFDMAGTVWSGTVRRASDGAAVAGVVVSAYSWDGFGGSASDPTDADGSFRLIVARGSSYSVGVFRQGSNIGNIGNVAAGADSVLELYVYASPSGGARWAGIDGGRSKISP